MPPEPLPWDHKDFISKERKHDRGAGFDALGGSGASSTPRWRKPYHRPRPFFRASLRRPPSVTVVETPLNSYSEDPVSCGCTPSRPDRFCMEDVGFRPSGSYNGSGDSSRSGSGGGGGGGGRNNRGGWDIFSNLPFGIPNGSREVKREGGGKRRGIVGVAQLKLGGLKHREVKAKWKCCNGRGRRNDARREGEGRGDVTCDMRKRKGQIGKIKKYSLVQRREGSCEEEIGSSRFGSEFGSKWGYKMKDNLSRGTIYCGFR